MELGEKLRAARLEAGLSQRQLCGEEITRNMLSQIEHGTAMPSMKTLQYLASRLGKSVSYFLEEGAVISPNQQVMDAARQHYDKGEFSEAAEALSEYRSPDPVYDREQQLLQALLFLKLAERAVAQKRNIYARELLGQVQLEGCYCAEALQRQRLLLWGKTGGDDVVRLLPNLDEELELRAKAAFGNGDLERAVRLLDAVEDQSGPEWNLLRGQILLAQTRYREAAQCLHRAEAAYPKEAYFRLEHCYRELEDYKRAYEYACRQKSGK
ncbi:MAG: helix-turn-helix domain-containing protein [Oscillospiraceae bacterium]|nr:helix-turn-helix domain-containing protein [Oscillospiraceae bacterium]